LTNIIKVLKLYYQILREVFDGQANLSKIEKKKNLGALKLFSNLDASKKVELIAKPTK
jgi:hypothetical protein